MVIWRSSQLPPARSARAFSAGPRSTVTAVTTDAPRGQRDRAPTTVVRRDTR